MTLANVLRAIADLVITDMAKDVSKEWLMVNRLCKEVRWLSYDPDYKEIDLKSALVILEELKEKLSKELTK